MASPIIQAQKSSSANNILVLVGVVVLAVGGWFAYTQFMPATVPGDLAIGGTQPVAITKQDWQKDIYANPIFTSLKSPLSGPLTVGRKSNPAPFVEEVKKEVPPVPAKK